MKRAATASRPIVIGGLIAGTLDIGAASLINWLNPVIILHYIASGLLGTRAFTLGAAAAYLGLILQWLMSILIAAIYFLVTARWQSLRTQWRLGGLYAGMVTFLVMNFVVVPLSAAPLTYRDIVEHFHPVKYIADGAAMLLFAMIIAYCAYRLSGETVDPGRAASEAVPRPGSTD
jgi:hypothetical protein